MGEMMDSSEINQKSEYRYDLPKHLIAQEPIKNRDSSRLMVLGRVSGDISHRNFTDITTLTKPGDCLVINDSKVIPARLHGMNKDAKVEILLSEKMDGCQWSVLAKPGRKAKPGDIISFAGGRLIACVEALLQDGLRLVRFVHEGDFHDLLEEIGEMPLPHYIEKKQEDTSRYQTVYAKHEGSVAAPTAGLHFTDEILGGLVRGGIKIARVTLHVGIGTFRPVKEEDITKHHMHSEYCRIEPETAKIINDTKKSGGRVIAVGTTSCRTIESKACEDGYVADGAGKTDIFIYPGYKFKVMDGIITNFHLPESTLIMLVAAFAGKENILNAYREAVKEEYRFFSYGDAMLIV